MRILTRTWIEKRDGSYVLVFVRHTQNIPDRDVVSEYERREGIPYREGIDAEGIIDTDEQLEAIDLTYYDLTEAVRQQDPARSFFYVSDKINDACQCHSHKLDAMLFGGDRPAPNLSEQQKARISRQIMKETKKRMKEGGHAGYVNIEGVEVAITWNTADTVDTLCLNCGAPVRLHAEFPTDSIPLVVCGVCAKHVGKPEGVVIAARVEDISGCEVRHEP